MPESDLCTRPSIPEDLMLSRLAQSEQMREFFIQMWLQNPAMAEQAGARVQAMLAPLGGVPPSRQRRLSECSVCRRSVISPR